VNYDRLTTGISREGALSAVYSAVDKIGNALGSAIFLAFLSLIGFVESKDGSLATQTPDVLRWITLAYVVAPALLHAGSIFVLNRYRLDPAVLRGAVVPLATPDGRDPAAP
jgi:Na+/melibiose symporter-like transporter